MKTSSSTFVLTKHDANEQKFKNIFRKYQMNRCTLIKTLMFKSNSEVP